MARNERKKITQEDKFAGKYYSDKSSRAIKKQERKINNRKSREYNKKVIEKSLDNYYYKWYTIYRR